jgi:hypothetical protein
MAGRPACPAALKLIEGRGAGDAGGAVLPPLREIGAEQVRAVLPAGGVPRATMLRALCDLFGRSITGAARYASTVNQITDPNALPGTS